MFIISQEPIMSTCRLHHTHLLHRAKERTTNAVDMIIMAPRSMLRGSLSVTGTLQDVAHFQRKHSDTCQMLWSNYHQVSGPDYFINRSVTYYF